MIDAFTHLDSDLRAAIDFTSSAMSAERCVVAPSRRSFWIARVRDIYEGGLDMLKHALTLRLVASIDTTQYNKLHHHRRPWHRRPHHRRPHYRQPYYRLHRHRLHHHRRLHSRLHHQLTQSQTWRTSRRPKAQVLNQPSRKASSRQKPQRTRHLPRRI